MKKLTIPVILLLTLGACSRYSYRSISNDNTNFSAYHTFAMIYSGDSTSSYYKNDIARDRIVNATIEQLKLKGLTVNNRRPDLLVKYSAMVSKNLTTYNEPVYYQPPPAYYGGYYGRYGYYYRYRNSFPVYVGDRERTVAYKEGNIIIDVIDRKTSRVVWRGWSEGNLDDAKQASDDIPKVVAKIFEKYPQPNK